MPGLFLQGTGDARSCPDEGSFHGTPGQPSGWSGPSQGGGDRGGCSGCKPGSDTQSAVTRGAQVAPVRPRGYVASVAACPHGTGFTLIRDEGGHGGHLYGCAGTLRAAVGAPQLRECRGGWCPVPPSARPEGPVEIVRGGASPWMCKAWGPRRVSPVLLCQADGPVGMAAACTGYTSLGGPVF